MVVTSFDEIARQFQREVDDLTAMYQKGLAAATLKLQAAVQGVDLAEGLADVPVESDATPEKGGADFNSYGELLDDIQKPEGNPFEPTQDG